MKNAFLFAIFIGLIGAVYYFEELGTVKEKEQQKREKQLIDNKELGKLIGIKTKTFEMRAEKSQFVLIPNKRRVDKEKLEKVLQILSNLKTKRVLNSTEIKKLSKEKAFPADSQKLTFLLERGEVSFLLGAKLPLDQSFYLEVRQGEKKRWVIAHDSTPEEGMYDARTNFRSDKKYQRLQNILGLPASFFFDTLVFGDREYLENERGWKYLKVSNNRNKSFGVHFNEGKTTPEVLEGITYLDSQFSTLSDFILKLRAREVFQLQKRGELEQPVGAFFLQDFEGKDEALQLYRKFQGKNGYFLARKGEDFVYQLDDKEGGIFFINVQDFWDKRFILPRDELTFSFIDKHNKKWKLLKTEIKAFQVNDADPSQKSGPSNVQFKKLFNFLNSQARYISHIDEEDTVLSKKRIFTLSFPKAIVDVILERGEIILMNRKGGYKLHYSLENETPFPLNAKGFFLNP